MDFSLNECWFSEAYGKIPTISYACLNVHIHLSEKGIMPTRWAETSLMLDEYSISSEKYVLIGIFNNIRQAIFVTIVIHEFHSVMRCCGV